MPELPEVETIRRNLQKTIVGKKIKAIEVRKAKIFQGKKEEVVGKEIVGIERLGKVLIIRLSGDKNLLVHFKLTGQMVWIPKAGKRVTVDHPIPFAGEELPAKTTHVILDINGGRLFYNDLRQFGWIKVRGEEETEKEVGKLGVEPLTEDFSPEKLGEILAKTKKPIKLVLMDQEKIAGVGNIYANDALFEAGILPTRPANTLDKGMIERLHQAIEEVLSDGLKYGGSSAKDEAYIKPTGEKGEYQKHFRVYQRQGEKCVRCKGEIKRVNLGGRGTFFCPKCQK